ncbi:Mu-like prophage major head subunit gpT family protein [Sorangium sp. So ce1667]
MAIIYSPAVAAELNVRLVTLYEQGALDSAASMSEVLDLCYVTSSDTVQNVYTIAEKDFSLYRRGRGADEFRADGIKVYEHRIENESLYRAVEISSDDFDDDKIGQYQAVFYKLGAVAALGPSEMVEDVVINAESLTGFDGVAFFSTSHPVKPKETGGTTWSNKLTKASGLTFTTFAEAYQAMREFPREDGKSAGAKGVVLAGPPSYEGVIMDICTMQTPSSLQGGQNPWFGRVKPMIVDNWKGVDAWYLFDTRSALERPLIFQERRPLGMVPLHTTPDDPEVKKHRKYSWMVDGRLGAGIGHPHRALKVVKS